MSSTTEASTPADSAETTDEQAEQPKPTETVDFWKQKAREQERRAKANAAAAKRLEELESASKTAEQKAEDRIAEATRRAEDAEKRSTALEIATEHHLGPDDAQLLAGMPDEDSMRSLAARLAEAAANQRQADEAERKKGPRVPNQGRDMGDPKADPNREFARRLFGRDT